MALDATPARRRPVTVTPPPAPLTLWAGYRAARRNLIDIIPVQAFHEGFVESRRARWIMVTDPDAIERVLKTRAAVYPRSDVTLRILRPREGQSLFTAPEAEWRFQHRAMTPMFQRRSLEGLVPVMASVAGETAERLSATQAREGVVDVYPEMVRATADVIADVALGARDAIDRAALTHAVTAFIERVARVSLLDVLGAPEWIPRPARLLDAEGRGMDRMGDRVIAERLARGPSARPDLLDMLIAARDPESGEGMAAVDLRNNLLAFIVAGHETTALALAWALYLVAFDPDVQKRARAEAQDVLGDRPATAADLARLPYVRQVIDEALRLYPPAGMMTKTAKADDKLHGRRVLPGTTVILPIWALHRHRALWDDPDAFDPDRFAPEARAKRHRFAYLPFSAGPHVCIGLQFALMEAQVILATILARFAVALPAGFAPEPRMVFTLRPGTGMPLKLRRL
ncbi:MAG: cytochrome P450 [Paracoccaceae bacterium]